MPDPIDPDETRGPFQATVRGVTDLLPAARFVQELEPGKRGVTLPMVASFIDEITARVALRMAGIERLVDDLEDTVRAGARELVHLGAASRAQAARYPEQSAKNSDSYAAVLWDQFESGLEALLGELAVQLDDPGAVEAPTPGQGVRVSFPPPRFTETMGF